MYLTAILSWIIGKDPLVMPASEAEGNAEKERETEVVEVADEAVKQGREKTCKYQSLNNAATITPASGTNTNIEGESPGSKLIS